MKIQYASDIHLELSDNSRFIKSMPFEVAGDVWKNRSMLLHHLS